MTNYPKAFEDYWSNAYGHIDRMRHLTSWQEGGLKYTAYLAWRAGRNYEIRTRKLTDTYKYGT